jgi:hypothetical protein
MEKGGGKGELVGSPPGILANARQLSIESFWLNIDNLWNSLRFVILQFL